MSNYRTYFADDANYEADLQAAYDELLGQVNWWEDTEESDIKLVALYRAKMIEKLETKLTALTKAIIEINTVLQGLRDN